MGGMSNSSDRAYRNSRLSQLHRPCIATPAATPRERSRSTRSRPANISSGRVEGDRWRPGGDNPTTPIRGVYYTLKVKIEADGAKPFELKAQPTVKVVAQYYGSDGKKTSGPEIRVRRQEPGRCGLYVAEDRRLPSAATAAMKCLCRWA